MTGKITDGAAQTGAGIAVADLLEILDVSDTSSAATGTNKKVRIDDLAAALAGQIRGLNAQTGTTYTLVAADVGAVVTMSNAAANTLTVPPNSTVAFPVGTRIEVAQLGAGASTIAAGAGVTLVAPMSTLVIPVQYAKAQLDKIATDTWIVTFSVEPNVEIAYADITASISNSASAMADAAGLSITIPAGINRPFMLHAYFPALYSNTAANGVIVAITDNANAEIVRARQLSSLANEQGHVDLWRRRAAGTSGTYKVRFQNVSGTTAVANMVALDTGAGAGVPFIRAVTV